MSITTPPWARLRHCDACRRGRVHGEGEWKLPLLRRHEHHHAALGQVEALQSCPP